MDSQLDADNCSLNQINLTDDFQVIKYISPSVLDFLSEVERLLVVNGEVFK